MTFLERIKKIDNTMDVLKATRFRLLREWVEAEHPLQLGTAVTANRYAHKGKTMIVTERSISFGYYGPTWTAQGKLYKADGSLGTRTAEWEQSMENPL